MKKKKNTPTSLHKVIDQKNEEWKRLMILARDNLAYEMRMSEVRIYRGSLRDLAKAGVLIDNKDSSGKRDGKYLDEALGLINKLFVDNKLTTKWVAEVTQEEKKS